LNEQGGRSNDLSAQQVTSSELPLAAYWQQFSDSNGLDASLPDASLARVIGVWPNLPKVVRAAIERACIQSIELSANAGDDLDHSRLAKIVGHWPQLDAVSRWLLIAVFDACLGPSGPAGYMR
jgi:hypothetical protein